MSSLSNLQKDFQDYILDTMSFNSSFTDSIQGHAEVYYEAYRLRLAEVLTIDYPKSVKLIESIFGTHAFEGVALKYIQRHPSKHFSVRYFGQHFSSFLSEISPYPKFPYLSELAEFEHCLLHSLDAKDAPAYSVDELKAIPLSEWPDLVFKLHPSVQYREFQYDCVALWKSIEPDSSEAVPVINQSSTACLFWRNHIRNLFEILPLSHQTFYKGILAQKTFDLICEDLFDITPEEEQDNVATTAIGLLQYWIEQQVIVGVQPRAST